MDYEIVDFTTETVKDPFGHDLTAVVIISFNKCEYQDNVENFLHSMKRMWGRIQRAHGKSTENFQGIFVPYRNIEYRRFNYEKRRCNYEEIREKRNLWVSLFFLPFHLKRLVRKFCFILVV